jgi:crotonobetainyl-CoA:carnitine CoA-transferase CaiB-like acyl-CoA transferase
VSASPLAGLLVVDLSRLLPGPLTTRLLADLGARVIKVEEPEVGDPVRWSPPRRGRERTGALAGLLLAGVESIALDLKERSGRTVLEALLDRADVLVESFRPGTLARLGFPPERLRERWPRLVVCSLSGWGADGPYAARAGHDLTYQAIAGGLASTAALPAAPVADLVGAWSAVSAVLAALLERERTGRGSHVDAALFDAGVHANLTAWAAEAGGRKKIGERLPLTGALPCYNLYRTAEGDVLALAALEPHFWRRFCAAARRKDLIRKQYSPSRRVHRKVAALVRSRTRAEWLDLLAREDIPAEMVLSAAEARAHPQTVARGVLSDGPDTLPRLAFPARIDGERPRSATRVPGHGEQTGDLLAELGLQGYEQAYGVGRRFSWKRLVARWWPF